MPSACITAVSRNAGLALAMAIVWLLGFAAGDGRLFGGAANAACVDCDLDMTAQVETPRTGKRERRKRAPDMGGANLTNPPRHTIPQPGVVRPPGRVAHCGEGEVFNRNRGVCVCRRGFVRGHGGCVPGGTAPPPPRVAECGHGEVFSKNRRACVCRKGLVRVDGACLPGRKEPPPPRVAECGHGEVYSKNRRACVCRKGLVRIDGACLPGRKEPPPVRVVECRPGEVFSRSREACVCRKGLVRIGGGCALPVPVVVERPAKPVIVVEPPAPPPPKPVVERKPKPAPVAEKKPAPVVKPMVKPVAAPAPKRQTLAQALVKRACLPPDLYDMLEQAYGRAPDVDRCEAACLAKPDNLAEEELEDMSARFGVAWCDDCIKLAGWLPLDDIQRLEELTGATFCMTGGASFCSAPGYARVDPQVTRVKVIERIRELPAALGKEGDVAVVIGNGAYGNGIASRSSATSDADAVITLLIDKLGYRRENVIDLRDATLADMLRVFGGADGVPGELGQLYGGKGNVLVYASAHGLREEGAGRSYLLPVDAREDDLAATAYALDDLYAHLSLLGAPTILLALEASFPTGFSPFIDPPNLPEAEDSVLPDTPVPGLAVLTASDRDQRTLDDPEFGTGLFTRYLIEGMAGMADAAPTGNGDKQIDTVELYVYTAHMVRTAARKSLGLEQKPLLSKVDNLLIGRLAAR